MAERRTMEERFWSKVNKTETCWLWTGGTVGGGYGAFRTGGRKMPHIVAHRQSYLMAGKAIEAGLQLDHLCRNRACVNPDHLEPVTQRENLLRGETAAARKSRQTHCIHGHLLIGENVEIKPDGCRRCIACTRKSGRLA